jgi:lysophospholipase L1-like esterase
VTIASYDFASILADGVEVGSFKRDVAYNATGSTLTTVDLGSSALRLIELVWPYSTGMDLTEIQHSLGAAVAIAPARPTTIFAALGDSITHGFNALKEKDTWAFQLAVAKGWQLKNFANGSALAVPAQGSALAGCGATKAFLMIGYNDWANNVTTATYGANVLAELQNMRTALPSAKIYASSPIYSTNLGANTNGNTLIDFRTAFASAFTTWADGNSQIFNGLSLMTNSSDRLADGIHPNITGATEISAYLNANMI